MTLLTSRCLHAKQSSNADLAGTKNLDRPAEQGISGLVVEYIVAIDVTRARFPADAYEQLRVKKHRFGSPTGSQNELRL